jgi:prepilin-type N-terminal cleavage/methylation domain-containing protein
MGERGFSMVELVTTLAIMMILLSIAGYQWHQVQVKSGVENQIKKLHADLQEVRLQALYARQPRRVVITSNQITIYPTSSATATPLSVANLKYPVVTNGSTALVFDEKGLASVSAARTYCILPTNDTTVVNDAAVDSLVISLARINLGKRTGGDCNANNVTQK